MRSHELDRGFRPISGAVALSTVSLAFLSFLVCASLEGKARAAEVKYVDPEYRNRIFTEPPRIQGVSSEVLASPAMNSVAITSGHVGRPGEMSTPNSAGVYLVRSVIGQPVAGNTARILGDVYRFGQPIVPEPTLGVVSNKPPYEITPQENARWIPGLNQLIAASPGPVDVKWQRPDGTTNSAVRYQIINEAYWNPVHLYHTHRSPSDLHANLTPNLTNAPTVTVPASLEVVVYWNSAVPEREVSGGRTNVFLSRATTSDRLQAAQSSDSPPKGVGFVLIEYRTAAGEHKGLEIVAVRSPEVPSVPVVGAHIGDRLLPANTNHLDTMVMPFVSRGISRPGDEANFAYQHSTQGSPQEGEVYAVRATRLAPAGEVPLEVFWLRRSTNGIVWPFEMTRYTADWPSADQKKYQLLARDKSYSNGGAIVSLPADQKASLMPFREPAGHVPADRLTATTFWTTDAGWSLLKMEPENRVAFLVVRSVLHDDTNHFDLGDLPAPIGAEIVNRDHQRELRPEAALPGYVHLPVANRGAWDRYDWEIYHGRTDDPPEFRTGQIIPVNVGQLEVWWANTNRGAQWWSSVKRYKADWMGVTNEIVIAAYQRRVIEREVTFKARLIDPQRQLNARLYVQNVRTNLGFNPNDEHALIDQGVVYALRDDLGSTNSMAYTLLKYRDTETQPRWHYTVYSVVAEKTPYFLHYPGSAGTPIFAPSPISVLPYSTNSYGVPGAGPHWRDRKERYWAMAAHNNGLSGADILMRWFYPAQEDFYFPEVPNIRTGQPVPWLDRRAVANGQPNARLGDPINVKYTVFWPDRIPTTTNELTAWVEGARQDALAVLGPNREVPALSVGETLITAKRGLSAIQGQCSVEIIFQQAASNKAGASSVQLIDPLKARSVRVQNLPADVARERVGNSIIFSKLPPELRKRLVYVDGQLSFQGFVETPALGEPWLLPNIITSRDLAILTDPQRMGSDATFHAALRQLASAAKDAIVVRPTDRDFSSLALTAGFATGVGYVTLAMQNNRTVCHEALPVSVEVIKVTCPLYRGFVRTVRSDSPFDEMQTMRFDGDLAGKSDLYEFRWQSHRDEGGFPPAAGSTGWRDDGRFSGPGAIDRVIEGADPFTLSDNWFRCQYRPITGGNQTCGAEEWSSWTEPQLAEGWIKRVIAGVNLFDQCFENLGDPTRLLNTQISMLSRAGKRWSGNVPLNTSNCDNYGLIELYETVLRRGISFSIEGTPALDDAAVNQSLLLAAGRLADLYMLLGNEAYADAADPTVGVPTPESGSFQGAPSSIHAFMNMTEGGANSLLDEELTLLRGRDDSRGAPGVETGPVFNRLVWNFSRGDGQVAYMLNYDIRDQTGTFDGKMTEADARVQYPQGHGDAYGHYLTAIKNYYRLIRSPNFTWIPRSEAVQIGGVPVTVDYLDERKFARAAAAKARAAAEIVNSTYRFMYSEDPSDQWKGYKDDYRSKKSKHPGATAGAAREEPRAWGLSEWGSRAGQGAFLDWVVGNALVPAKYAPTYRLTANSLAQLEAGARYRTTAAMLLNAASRAGAPLFAIGTNEITDPQFLEARLKLGAQPIDRHIRSLMSFAYQAALAATNVTTELRNYLDRSLLLELNHLVQGGSIHDETGFAGVSLSSRTLDLLMAGPRADQVPELNRLLLADAFPAHVTSESALLQGLIALGDRQFDGRQAITDAVRAAVTTGSAEALLGEVLAGSRIQGLPETAFQVLEALQGTHYPAIEALEADLRRTNRLGPDVFDQFGAAIIASVERGPIEPPPGTERIDRESVVELREVTAAMRAIQQEVDKADLGLNPLGLVKNVLPFDIDPSQIDRGVSHFEQIYERAVTALNNAIAVFNRAAASTQALRRQADEQAQFEKTVREREIDFKGRMIELYGYPYPEDIGGAGAYPDKYDGPDIYHYSLVDPSELLGEPTGPTEEVKVTFKGLTADLNQTRDPIEETQTTVTFHISKNGFGEVKPPSWTGRRRAPGAIQVARSDLVQARARFDRAVLEYGHLLAQIEDQAALLRAQYDLNATELQINLVNQKTQFDLNAMIRRSRERQLDFQTKGRIATLVANAVAEGMPKVVGGGFSWVVDPAFIHRQVVLLAGSAITEAMTQNSNRESLAELDHQQAKELAQSQTSIELSTLRNEFALNQQLKELQRLLRSEASQRLEIYTVGEAMQQTAGKYLSTLASAERLQEDFLRFRRETAGDTSLRRYKDMAFRIFRNDALQKYRAQFDLAASYVYMAARAYDWETGLLEGDSRKPGQGFLSEIIRTRAIGLIQDNRPQTASSQGDPGLADPMARMSANWQVLKGQLGFYTQQHEQNRFSLRREFFRILPSTNAPNAAAVWRRTLREHVVPNILEDSRYQRFARPFATTLSAREPAIVIPFESNVTFAQNFFGWPLGPNDSAYSASLASTKIRSVGVWFAGYNTTGLGNTPRVYLIPIGDDLMRSPSQSGNIRQWTVVDQALPAPFAISIQSVARDDWIPTIDTLSGSFVDIRRYADFRAYHDSGTFKQDEVVKDSRLIGRSVWNSKWLLIIPAGTLLSDRQEAIDTFIDGRLVAGKRDGNGVSDILLLFQTYATPGL